MGSAATANKSVMGGEAPPPPAGPPVVDPTAPGLTPECFGIGGSDTKPGARAARPAETPAAPARPAAAPERGSGTDMGSVRRPFNTELDICPIDDRGRPGPTWSAKARELSRGELVFFSRRMCYPGAHKIVLIHLIDSTPVAVYGVIDTSEYEGDGLYRVEMSLRPMPPDRRLHEWIEARRGRVHVS